MKTKNLVFAILTCIALSVNAQSVEGQLNLNGKSKMNLELKSNSAVQLFKDFKTGKYKLGFSFKGKELVKNLNKEEVVFFEFITVVKKDGKLVKNVVRKQPIPYFPGDMNLPAEAFDFIGILANLKNENPKALMEKGTTGLMEAGNYSFELYAKPVGVGGKVNPVLIQFKI